MIIHTDTFIPYEFDNIDKVVKFIIERASSIPKSLRLLEKTKEHLYLRCPIAGDYLEIIGTENELDTIHNKLTLGNWYRLK